MIELYVVVTLCAIGYLINQNNSDNIKRTTPTKPKLSRSEVPSMNNIYDSRYTGYANASTQRLSYDMVQKSKHPGETGVISRNYKLNNYKLNNYKLNNYKLNNYKLNNEHQTDNKNRGKKVKLMTGEEIDASMFKHNNMQPFYGGKIKQNIDEFTNSSKLESFTGVINDYKPKCEVPSFFDKTKDMNNPYGMQNMNEFYQDRVVAPRVMNNVSLVPKIHVGPGINKGYSADAVGGFHQTDYRDCILPKTVDDLRVATNPKVSYKARTLDGMKAKLPGKSGKVNKNRVETFWEQTPDKYLVTTGAQLKKPLDPNYVDKVTNRQNTTKEYTGGALYQNGKGRTLDPNVRTTSKYGSKGFGIRNASLADIGTGLASDYGKSKIMVYGNERDVTSTRVHQGNVTSIIKALVAPLQDLVRITRKEGTIDNPRHFGNITPQFPDKQTVYDPNDYARTTIKETTLIEAILGNLRGAKKHTVHDPDDVARTTLKETTLSEAALGNLRGKNKLTVYDPDDIARTTLKETTLSEAALANLRGKDKLTVYDPDDIARTTLKETTLGEASLGNLRGKDKLTVYDPDDIARTTLKETTLSEAALANLRGKDKLTVYDPDDIARTTLKETTLGETALGNLRGKDKLTVYDPNDIARTTLKETTLSEAALANLRGKNKLTVYDPDDIARTTLKETTLGETALGNLRGKDKLTVYDPNDIARTTLKETTLTEAALGNLRGKNKLTVYDPDDIARTTLKETTLSEAALANLRGKNKLTVYDPDDIARTTLKETTLTETALGNLRGRDKLTVYDPDDIARTTIKETTLGETSLGNLRGRDKLTVYDPNDVARTTIKETLIHDNMGAGTVTGPKQLYIYDPDEVAKRTLRETLDKMDYNMNLSAKVYRGKVYDPDDKARVTIKELTEALGRDGNIGLRERTGEYISDGYDAKNTQKQFYSDIDYYGIVGLGTKVDGDGYLNENFDMKLTQKQFLSDVEYFGNAEASSDKKQMSYDDKMNARIRPNKEVTLFGREPTQEGTKVANGAECLNVQYREPNAGARSIYNMDRIPNVISSLSDITLTREKKMYDRIEEERLDPSILKAFIENPYTQPLDSVA